MKPKFKKNSLTVTIGEESLKWLEAYSDHVEMTPSQVIGMLLRNEKGDRRLAASYDQQPESENFPPLRLIEFQQE